MTAEHQLVEMIDERVDGVLVVIGLPGIQGLDLTKSVRVTGQTPILIVTGQTDNHDVLAGLEAGADDYVTKPFVAQELTARIRTQLRGTPAGGDGLVVDNLMHRLRKKIEVDPASPDLLATVRDFGYRMRA